VRQRGQRSLLPHLSFTFILFSISAEVPERGRPPLAHSLTRSLADSERFCAPSSFLGEYIDLANDGGKEERLADALPLPDPYLDSLFLSIKKKRWDLARKKVRPWRPRSPASFWARYSVAFSSMAR